MFSCRAWPNITCIDQKWEKLINPLFERLLEKNVVYTHADSGRWLTAEEAVFDQLLENEPKELLLRVLLAANVPVVSVPNHVMGAITYYSFVKEIKPTLVRSTMKQIPSCYKKLDRRERLLLLNFCLKDGKFDKLCDLELLPLSNGTFTKLSSHSKTVYICSPEHPRELFPSLEHRFLDETIDVEISRRLIEAGKKGKMHCFFEGFIFILKCHRFLWFPKELYSFFL